MDSRFSRGQSSTSSNTRFTQGVLSTSYDTPGESLTFSDSEGESSTSYDTPGESFTFSDSEGESSTSYDTPGESFTFFDTEGESSTSSKFFYDVFLSFSGKDTRKKFVGHLENRLCQDGFQIFKDDKSLRKGDVISMALEKGIENSRISIVVLSTNYASSRWCLDELVKILECKEKLKQRVMPIFYDVEPTEVRKQTGKFGDGFVKLKERFGDQSMEKWKAALTEVANLSGSELRVVANGEIATLVQKHLLQRDGHCLVMHDLVRDMGREIVRLESTQCPGGRSRLFIHKEVSAVLLGNTGTKKVEVLISRVFLDNPLGGVTLSTEVFQKMKNLRVLIIDGLCVSGDFGLFPKQLKWLSWQRCPLERIPSNFPAANLVFLNMEQSNMKEFDLNLQCCPMLKELDLSFCEHLRRTPKFNGAKSLETLLLYNCSSLTEIDPSICQLKSLQLLNITLCRKLQTLPVDLGDVQSLRYLWASDTGVKQLPKSVEKLKNLGTLDVDLYLEEDNVEYFPSCGGYADENYLQLF